MSKQSPMISFSNKLHHDTYKLLMADFSQVCEGQTLVHPTHKNRIRVRPQSKCGDDCQVSRLSLDKELSSSGECYYPVRNARHDTQRENQDLPGTNLIEPTCDEDLLSSTESSSSSITHSVGSNASSYESYRPEKRHSYPRSSSSENGDRQPRTLIRQKYQPHHRNTSLNKLVSGVMKPSRYCSDVPQRRASVHGGSSCSFMSDLSCRSDESWVPPGVEFSATSEVYFYKKQ